MIFVTVGSQMPFDRLVQAVDAWAGLHPEQRVLAQVGQGAAPTRHLDRHEALSPIAFRQAVQQCRLVVAHAGMGSVLTALDLGKPMLLMPRRGALRETRNDHQLATLRWLQGKPGVIAAFDEEALQHALDDWLRDGARAPDESKRTAAQQALVNALRDFIAS